MNLNRIVLGTAQFGLDYGIKNSLGRVKISEAKKILLRAKEEEIFCLDTARVYGYSEESLGTIELKDWRISTKFPPLGSSDSATYIMKSSLKKSFNNLKVEKVYSALLHRSSDLLEEKGPEIYKVLQGFKSEGLIEKIGVSIYDPKELDLIFNKYEIDLIQAPFSVIDRSLLTSGWLCKLKQKSVELHVRSIFLQGLLLMSEDERQKYFDKWSDLWIDWKLWLEEMKINPLEACLNYVLSQRSVDRIIVGVDSLVHFNQIIDIVKKPLRNLPFPNRLSSSDAELINPSRWEIE